MPATESARTSWDLLVSPAHLDEALDDFPVPAGAVVSVGAPNRAGAQIDQIAGRLERNAQAVAEAGRTIVLAGDCLTSLATVAGLQRRGRDVSVVWLDAHGDFNTPAISTSGYLAGMSLAMLTGRSLETFGGALGLRPIPDERVVLIDARDLDPAERSLLESSRIRRIGAEPQAVRAAVAGLPAGEMYLHVDLDIIDSREVPGLRWDAGAGPALSTVEDCVSQIVDVATPAAACIACPWPARLIAEKRTRDVVSRVAMAIGTELRWATEHPGQSG